MTIIEPTYSQAEIMTKADIATKERAEIMLASIYDGILGVINVEVKSKSDIYANWIKASQPCWDWLHCDYRIIPEPPKPEYVPYEWNDRNEIIGRTILGVINDRIIPTIILNINFDGVWIAACLNSGCCTYEYPHEKIKPELSFILISFDKLLTDFTFLDGSPCGKLKK